MQFYEQLSTGDLTKTLQNNIVKQNSLLHILQEQPEFKSHQIGYETKLAQG